MNINENFKNEVKSKKKHINKRISVKNITKPPLLPVFISPMIQFDKFFHPVVLYENNLICIFMNINENVKINRKPLGNLVFKGVIRPKLNT